MRILVTGAGGYLGCGTVKALLDAGAEVAAVDINTDRTDDRADIYTLDLFAEKDLFKKTGVPDAVLHLAWRNGFNHNADTHIGDLPHHTEFIKYCAENGVKRISTMGSMHEIGVFEGSIREDTPCNPANFYGIAKNALRQAAKLICQKNGVVFQWLRGYYIVGNPQFGCSVFSKIYEAQQNGKEKFPFTSGKNQYDFLDYGDFCRLTAAAAMQDGVDGIINICSGEPVALGARVERFIKENGYKIKLDYGAFPDRPYDCKAVWGDSRKIDLIMKNAADKKDE